MHIVSIADLPAFNKNISIPNHHLILVGGVFDIVHVGHIRFLQAAKALGDILIILLESDLVVKRKKGANRPINSQNDRALVLSNLRMVDYVILLPNETNQQTYIDVTKLLKPAIIATTKGDPHRKYKETCAALVNAKVIDVIEPIEDASTSNIARLLQQE